MQEHICPTLTPTVEHSQGNERRLFTVFEDLGENQEFFVELLEIFATTIGQEWQLLLAAVQAENHDEIKRQAHSLKGAISIWSDGPLDRELRELDYHAATGETELVLASLDRIPQVWHAFLSELKSFVASRCPDQSPRIHWRLFEKSLSGKP